MDIRIDEIADQKLDLKKIDAGVLLKASRKTRSVMSKMKCDNLSLNDTKLVVIKALQSFGIMDLTLMDELIDFITTNPNVGKDEFYDTVGDLFLKKGFSLTQVELLFAVMDRDELLSIGG